MPTFKFNNSIYKADHMGRGKLVCARQVECVGEIGPIGINGTIIASSSSIPLPLIVGQVYDVTFGAAGTEQEPIYVSIRDDVYEWQYLVIGLDGDYNFQTIEESRDYKIDILLKDKDKQR
jgi:hypothetical protein